MNHEIKVIDPENHRDGINNWIENYFDWYLSEFETWLEQTVTNEELLSTDWERKVEQAIKQDRERIMDDSDTVVIGLLSDDSVIGGSYYHPIDNSKVHLYRLWVPENLREEGYGERLIKKTCKVAKENGFEKGQGPVGPYQDTALSIYEDIDWIELTDEPKRMDTPELEEYWYFIEITFDEVNY